MTRERWEQILFAHVPDEVVQDMLNAYVLELEAENAKLFALLKHESEQVKKLQEFARHMHECMGNIDADGNYECDSCEYDNDDGGCDFERLMEELGVTE